MTTADPQHTHKDRRLSVSLETKSLHWLIFSIGHSNITPPADFKIPKMYKKWRTISPKR